MMQKNSLIAFVSTLPGNHWGGSEELWSQTALRLAGKRIPIAVNVSKWTLANPVFTTLQEAGVIVQQRYHPRLPLLMRAWRKLYPHDDNRPSYLISIEAFLRATFPKLVVFSDGAVLPPVEVMELCVKNRWPFVTLGHANYETWWPDDDIAERLREALPAAVRCYFVSRSNQTLVENHLGVNLTNAEIVRNPFNVAFDAAPRWPSFRPEDELRLACVGRLQPIEKGQDILFGALSHSSWAARRWRLTLYGDGPVKKGLARLADRLGLGARIDFAGHVSSVNKIWSENHVLLMPSRWEGMPLTVVEAMLCARPVVATDVGGIKEIVEDGVTGFLATAPTVESFRGALENMWTRRADLQAMGKAAAKVIRTIVPSDPIDVFLNKLLKLV